MSGFEIAAGIAAVASAAMTVAASQQQASVQRSQARMADFNATTEAIRGRIQSNQTRQAMLRTLATQSARYAGSGLSLEGTPDLVAQQTVDEANRQLTVDSSNSTIRSEQQRQQADLLRSDANWSETGGYMRAGVNLFQAYSGWAGRQPGSTGDSSSWGSGGGGDSSSWGSL